MEGGSVVRYHTRPGIKPDTDAHHSHGVIMFCELLSGGQRPMMGASASANLLMAAATHDLGEQKVGDVPAPAKRALSLSVMLGQYEDAVLQRYSLDYAQYLTEAEQVVLKLADCFDGMMYCCRELALGNRNSLLVWRRYCSYVETLTAVDVNMTTALRASHIYEAIKQIHQEITSASGPNFDVFADS